MFYSLVALHCRGISSTVVMAALQACYVTRKKRNNKAVCGQQTWLVLGGESKPIISISQRAVHDSDWCKRNVNGVRDELELVYVSYDSSWSCNRKKASSYLQKSDRADDVFPLNFGNGILHFIQINHQPDAKFFQFIIQTSVYSSTCFGRFPAPHQELNDCSGSL